MSQNEKRLFDRHKKQEESPLEQTQAVPAVQDEITAEPAAEVLPKRNKYADKMNRKKRRLSKGARIGITAAAVALLLGGGIWAVVKSRDAGTEDVTQTTAMVSCGDLETYIEGSGVTAAKKREELGREVKGKVTQVLVAEGDEVHTGDPLLVIDPQGTCGCTKGTDRGGTRCLGRAAGGLQGTVRLERGAEKTEPSEHHGAVYRQTDSGQGFGRQGCVLPCR